MNSACTGRRCRPGRKPRPAPASIVVLARDDFAKAVTAFARDTRTIYTTFRAEVLGEASSTDPAALWRATKADPWDGRVSREEQFIQKLKAAAPAAAVKDLDPILDELRAIKSAREIAVIREATRITGLAIMEAMRDAAPGMKEYELQADAEFVFKKWRRLRAVVFRADRHGTQYLLFALPQEHRDAERRRPGAVRLRAGLQVLPIGRHARLSGERPVHAAATRVLLDLPEAVSGGHDVDPAARLRVGHHQGRRRQDGRDHDVVPVQRSEDQDCGDGFRAGLSSADGERPQPRPLRRHGSARRRRRAGDLRARDDLHHRTRDADRRRASRTPTGRHDPDHADRVREHVGVRPRGDRRDRKADERAGTRRAR